MAITDTDTESDLRTAQRLHDEACRSCQGIMRFTGFAQANGQTYKHYACTMASCQWVLNTPIVETAIPQR